VLVPPPRRFTLDQELFALKQQTRGVVELYQRGKGFRFVFVARPSPLGREYRIMIDRLNRARVFVLEPNLRTLADDRTIPHIYSTIRHPKYPSAICLCLYHPDRNESPFGTLLSDTLVPWTILWLYFFESWLVSNVWEGGGEHPM